MSGTSIDKQMQNLRDKAARGEYELVEPLDYVIMGVLPVEGTLFGGLYPLGETVANIAKKLPKGPDNKSLASSIIQTRLRILKEQGLVLKKNSIPGANGRSVWQKTNTGEKLVESWKGKSSGD